MEVSTWLPLRFWHIWGGGNFIDTSQVLAFGDCYRKIGLEVYSSTSDPCTHYLYGRSLLQFLGWLHLGMWSTKFIGYLFMLIISLILSRLYLWQSRVSFFVSLLIFLSPPILLLVERGNFDILIVAALFMAGFFWEKELKLVSLILIFLVSLLKFYTAPLLLIFLFLACSRKIKVFSIVLFTISVPIIIRDIRITSGGYPHGSNTFFGMNIWVEYFQQFLNSPISPSVAKIVGASIFVVLTIFVYQLLHRKNLLSCLDYLQSAESDSLNVFRLLSGVTFLLCFFVGMNFDYRLVFLVIVAGYAKLEKGATIQNVISGLVIMALWLSYPSGGLQPIGDAALEIIASLLLLEVLAIGLKQLQGLRLKSTKSSKSL